MYFKIIFGKSHYEGGKKYVNFIIATMACSVRRLYIGYFEDLHCYGSVLGLGGLDPPPLSLSSSSCSAVVTALISAAATARRIRGIWRIRGL